MIAVQAGPQPPVGGKADAIARAAVRVRHWRNDAGSCRVRL